MYVRACTPAFHRGIVNETFDELEPDSRLRNVRMSCLRDNEAIIIDDVAGCHYISRFVKDDSVHSSSTLSYT
jgi:hypothetical protein